MRLPRLLNDNLGEACRLHPSALAATIQLTPPSTVNMTLPDGEPMVGVRRWVEVYGPSGSLGIFRARSPGMIPGTEQRIRLEHGIVTLEDDLTPAETTLTGSLKSIAGTLLGYQSTSRWRLGSAPDSGSYTLEVNETNLLKALLDAVKLAEGYRLTFDQTSIPWVVNFVAMSATPMCECRLRRNTVGVNLTEDDSDLCTRAVSAALPGGYLDADTVARWGVVAKPLGIAEDTDASEALAYAREYVEARKNIAVSIEVDALYLAEQTGEALDRFREGALCRVALPDYGMVRDERVIAMRFDDLLRTAKRVKLTLSAPAKDVSRGLAKLNSDASSLKSETTALGTVSRGHGASIQKQAVELEKTYEYTELVEGQLTDYKNYVGIQLDEKQAQIRLKASKESVNELGTRLSSAEILIDGANAEIALKASKESVNAMGTRVSNAEATLTMQANEISTKVSKNGVISSINQTAESIRIQASKINLEGYVTASQLSTEVAKINIGIASTIATNSLRATSAVVDFFMLRDRYISMKDVTVIKSLTPASTETVTLLVA